MEPPQFEPSKADNAFQIAIDNYAAIVLVPPLAARLVKAAPGVTLEFRPSGTLNVLDLLDRGQLDLAIGPPMHAGERFSQQPLLEDTFVLLLRKNHASASAKKLTVRNPRSTARISKYLPRRMINLSSTSRCPGAASNTGCDARVVSFGRAHLGHVGRRDRPVAAGRERELMGYRPLVMRELPFSTPAVLDIDDMAALA